MFSDYVKSLDNTRFTTLGIQHSYPMVGNVFPHPDFFSEVDICGYNYERLSRVKRGEYEPNYKKFGKIMCQSESMNRFIFEEWQNILSIPYVIGDYIWTGIDYLGEIGCWENFEY